MFCLTVVGGLALDWRLSSWLRELDFRFHLVLPRMSTSSSFSSIGKRRDLTHTPLVVVGVFSDVAVGVDAAVVAAVATDVRFGSPIDLRASHCNKWPIEWHVDDTNERRPRRVM